MITLKAASMPLSLTLHPSLYHVLWKAAGLGKTAALGEGEAKRLDYWADALAENTAGTKADLARSIAGLIRVAGELRVTTATTGPTFWEAASR
jgi:hypothetical protein